jgi:hypothetical protein
MVDGRTMLGYAADLGVRHPLRYLVMWCRARRLAHRTLDRTRQADIEALVQYRRSHEAKRWQRAYFQVLANAT